MLGPAWFQLTFSWCISHADYLSSTAAGAVPCNGAIACQPASVPKELPASCPPQVLEAENDTLKLRQRVLEALVQGR